MISILKKFSVLGSFRRTLNFTAITCMVSVLIFSLLSTDQVKGQAGNVDGSSRDAITFLESIADGQVYHFAMNNEWAGQNGARNVFATLKLKPAGSVQYAFYCGNDSIVPKSAENGFNFPDPSKNWPYSLRPDITVSDFVCMAIANNDTDKFPDVWMINKFKQPVHLLDDKTNQMLVDIVNQPFNAEAYFGSKIDMSEKRELSNLYIEINLPAYRLDLYDEGRYIKSYQVAIGMRGYKSPSRTFYMERMDWNPWWYPPNASWCKKKDEEGNVTGCKPVGPGRSNPLGPVKMILQSSILIHGTNKPWSVGRAASHGCFRMRSDDAKELAWEVMVLSGATQQITNRDRYHDGSRRTYQVKLTRPVQVNTIYERLEVFDGKLRLLPDPYGWQPLTSSEISSRVKQFGVPLEQIDEGTKTVLLGGRPKNPLEISIKF